MLRPNKPMDMKRLLFAVLLAAGFLLSACASPQATQALIQVEISADGQTIPLQIAAGSTVQQALDKAKLSMKALDRSDPPVYTVLGDGMEIRLVRVTEDFEIEQVVIPYEQQTLRNESLPVEKEVLIQKGKEGLQEITYRRVYEDGVQVSDQPIPIKSVIVQEPVPEIRMIGVQTPFAPVPIPGKLYYLRDGNIWKIEGTTANRQAVLTLGDLDGRIFTISQDGSWAAVHPALAGKGPDQRAVGRANWTGERSAGYRQTHPGAGRSSGRTGTGGSAGQERDPLCRFHPRIEHQNHLLYGRAARSRARLAG